MTYKISIIIPVFNVENYLKDSLESIVRQTIGLENLEVIMVDDCSTDGSRNIMQDYSNRYDNFISVFIDNNSGAAGKPRNIGIETASGEYLMFLDPDDYFEDNACEILYNKIKKTRVDMVSGKYAIQYRQGIDISKTHFDHEKEVVVESIEEAENFLAIPASIWTKIYKTEFIRKNHIIFPERIPGQDLAFVAHTLLLAKGIIFINEIIANYRIRGSSITFNRSKKHILGLIEVYKYIYRLYKDKNKERFFSHILKGNLVFLIKQLTLSKLSLSEKKEILKTSLCLFKKYRDYELIPPSYMKPVFDLILKEKYDDAILLTEGLLEQMTAQEKSRSPLKMDINGFKSIDSKISVIIPAYNVENYISSCLSSIINQTLGIRNIEVIIVNDCSNDETALILKEYADRYESIKIINQDINRGPGPARNLGLKYSNSDYVSFVDGDDKISINTFEKTLEIAQKYDSDLIIYEYKHFNNKNTYFPKTIHQEIFNTSGIIDNIIKYPNLIFATSAANKIYSKNLIKEITFPAKLYEDNIFSAKALFKAQKIFITDTCTYLYRQRIKKDSITQQKSKIKCFDLIDINIQLKNLKVDFPQYSDMIKYINLHFADKNILKWMFEWQFNIKERKQIFTNMKKILRDITSDDIDNFNKLYSNFKILRKELIMDIINHNYAFFFLKYDLSYNLKQSLVSRMVKNDESLKISMELEKELSEINEIINIFYQSNNINLTDDKIRELYFRADKLNAVCLENIFFSNKGRSYTQRLISRFPKVYIAYKMRNTGWNNIKTNIKGYKNIKKLGLFDFGYYLYYNEDVRLSGTDPLIHYLFHGFKENRKPNPSFNPEEYLKKNDISDPNFNPLIHYSIKNG